MKLYLDLALTHLKGRIRQTVLSMLGVATGVGFSIAMASLMQGSQNDFIRRVVDLTPHVVVKDEYRHPPAQPVHRLYAGGAVELAGVKPKEELRGIRNPKPRVAALNGIPDVAAAPILRGQVVFRYGGKDVAAALVGIEPKLERRVSAIEKNLTRGTLDDLYGSANGVILGRALAAKLGVATGKTLTVSSPAGVVMRMKVVGQFHTGILALDQQEAYALIKRVQVLMERPNVVNEIRLRLDDATKASALARRVEARLGYRSESWDEANEGILDVFLIRNIIMYATVGSILVVAAFGIFNIVSTIIYEKVRDIAILKSIGFHEKDIRAIFLFEGSLIGGLGTLAGWGFGYALYRVLGAIPIKVQMYTEMDGLPVIFSLVHYAIAGGAGLVAAVVAGYLPARKAAQLNPVDIIRGAT